VDDVVKRKLSAHGRNGTPALQALILYKLLIEDKH
jgi:hypothetical protein